MKSTVAAVRPGFGQLAKVAAVLLVSGLFSAEALPQAAPGCEGGTWSYTVPRLQSARGLLRAIQTASGKVSCAKAILRTPGLGGPFPEHASQVCPRLICAKEFAGLLSDVAVYMRTAASRASTTADSQKAYIEDEVVVRRRLYDFLLKEGQAAIRSEYFDLNLVPLTDAMQRVGQAKEVHDLLSELSDRNPGILASLSLFPFKVWIEAVRSCPEWNLKSDANREALCQTLGDAECIDAFNATYEGLKAAKRVLPNGKVKSNLPLFPAPAACGITPQ